MTTLVAAYPWRATRACRAGMLRPSVCRSPVPAAMYSVPDPPSDVSDQGAAVADALLTRRSVRGFLSTPVDRETVEGILYLASRTPSGTNIQPWRAYACTGAVREALSRELLALHNAGDETHVAEYAYYPVGWREPYLSRRRKLGWDYYGIMGLTRED